MTEYTAELPWNLSDEDLEALRGVGEVRLIFEADFDSRRSAIAELGDEFGWRHGMDRSWWDEHLSGRRARTEGAL